MTTISAAGWFDDGSKQDNGKTKRAAGKVSAAVSSRSREAAPKQKSPNIAVTSWGHGVVGCSKKTPCAGVVTSRGINKLVKPSTHKQVAASKYASYRQEMEKNRDLSSNEHQAAITIQRHLRGFQARQMKKREEEMATKIQRQYRRWKDSGSHDCDSSTIVSSDLSTDLSTGISEFADLQAEINKLNFSAESKFEELTLGDDCQTPRLVIIASNVPHARTLQRCVREDVLSTVYDFGDSTLPGLLRTIRTVLHEYKPGVKAKSVAFVCQGGPGYFYLLAGKVITSAKLSTNKAISKFWVAFGDIMSKINPDEAYVDFIGSYVAGNRQGEQLLQDLENLMQPNVVHTRSLLEQSPTGLLMLDTYFNIPSYKTWKMTRHSKMSLM
ncbi:NMDA receptor synaptonuclear signaling and neuronal migration factor-like [Corticium candelabrum]|uniref:NMDA receptor synaptonuclear signaling and neuronal migration factor-like n=1 Tax=Corticium candelabrum TaxID=121492 RepID=UPI002E275C57|nr:NMDA receptor synaptonuclear signaling and neuronal migration factor-like [Corticium candelabrum]